jgi:hypothetical protein
MVGKVAAPAKANMMVPNAAIHCVFRDKVQKANKTKSYMDAFFAAL